MKLIITTKPISVNKLYQGRRFLTPEGKSTKLAMCWEIKSQWRHPIITGEVSMSVTFYFKDRRGLDIDGAIKGLLDCMTGLCYTDDRQIVDLDVHKRIDAKKPRIEIVIN